MLVRALQHHGLGIPTNNVLDLLLQFAVAGIVRLILGRNGVEVGRVQRSAAIGHAFAGEQSTQVLEQFLRAAPAMRFQDFLHGLQPFSLFELPFVRLGQFSHGGHQLLVISDWVLGCVAWQK